VDDVELIAVLLTPGHASLANLLMVDCGCFPAAVYADQTPRSFVHGGAQPTESDSVSLMEELEKKQIQFPDYRLLRPLCLP